MFQIPFFTIISIFFPSVSYLRLCSIAPTSFYLLVFAPFLSFLLVPLKWLMPILPWTLLPPHHLCLSQCSRLTQPLSPTIYISVLSREDQHSTETAKSWDRISSPLLFVFPKGCVFSSTLALSCDHFSKTLHLRPVPRGVWWALWMMRLPSLQPVLSITSFFYPPTCFPCLMFMGHHYSLSPVLRFPLQPASGFSFCFFCSWWFHFLHWNLWSSVSLDQMLYFSR